MALKSLLFVSLLVAVGAAPVAEAQIGNIIGYFLSLIRIQGKLFCTENGGVGVYGTATPVFPNAVVQLQCGAGNMISSATTNTAGIFSMNLDPLQFTLSSLLTNCNLVVNTPLSTCNADLPSSGSLISPLLHFGNTLLGFANMTNLIPAGFKFFPNL